MECTNLLVVFIALTHSNRYQCRKSQPCHFRQRLVRQTRLRVLQMQNSIWAQIKWSWVQYKGMYSVYALTEKNIIYVKWGEMVCLHMKLNIININFPQNALLLSAYLHFILPLISIFSSLFISQSLCDRRTWYLFSFCLCSLLALFFSCHIIGKRLR